MEMIYGMFIMLIGFFTICLGIIFTMFKMLNKTIVQIETIRKCETYSEAKEIVKEPIPEKTLIDKTIEKTIKMGTKAKQEDDNWLPGVGTGYDFKK